MSRILVFPLMLVGLVLCAGCATNLVVASGSPNPSTEPTITLTIMTLDPSGQAQDINKVSSTGSANILLFHQIQLVASASFDFNSPTTGKPSGGIKSLELKIADPHAQTVTATNPDPDSSNMVPDS